jgi:hypothetical protein
MLFFCIHYQLNAERHWKPPFWSSIIILEHFESFDILSNITKGMFLSIILYVVVIIDSFERDIRSQPFVNK